MTDSHFITLGELLEDPEPLIVPAGKRVKDKKSNKMVDANVRFFLRRPTDIERQMALSAANRARRTLRAKLADPESEEHRLLLREPLEEASDEQLRELWINGTLLERAPQLQLNSLEERGVIPEPEGELVTPAERDEYEHAVEQAERDRLLHLVEAIGNLRKQLEREAKEIEHDALLAAAMPAHTETIVGNEWNDTFTAYLIATGTYHDKQFQKPWFKTVSEVVKLRSQKPHIYSALADAHKGLMIEAEPTLGK